MIQDIYPSRLDNQYKKASPRPSDYLLFFDEQGQILVKAGDGKITFPVYGEEDPVTPVFLFTVDERSYFLECAAGNYEKEGFAYYSIRKLRDIGDGKEIFAAFTAYHLWRWYADNRFCGRCGKPLMFHEKERAMECPHCKNVIYPRINPAVIVGVIRGEELLLTRYRTGYANNALVAGFVEIGETMEETVAREVMEETGVAVFDIRYYKSQPWGMAQDILAGYYCYAAPDAEIKMDETELKYAEWVKREEIVLQPNNLSLTNEMMRMFKEGKIR